MQRSKARSIVSSKQWDSALSGETKSLAETLPPLRGDKDPRKLLTLYPRQLPGWVVEVTSTHSLRKTIQWLMLRMILFPETERRATDLLKILVSNQDSPTLQLLTKILFRIQVWPVFERELIYHKIILLQPDALPPSGRRYISSFRPRIILTRWWADKQRLRSKRYVGIGYNDHGSLGTGPSWKAQMLSEGEDLPENMAHLNLILEYVERRLAPSSRGSPFPGKQISSADESKQGRNEANNVRSKG